MYRSVAMATLFALLTLPLMGQESCYGPDPEQEDLIDAFCMASENCGDGTFEECWSERSDEHEAAQTQECVDEFDTYLICIEAHGACYEGGDGMFYWQDGTCDEVEQVFYDCAGL